MDKNAFDTFSLNDNKYQLDVENYLPTERVSDVGVSIGPESADLASRRETRSSGNFMIHICTWDYLPKTEVKNLLGLKGNKNIRTFIQKKLRKKVKGMPRVVYRELMYTVTKFCKKSDFTADQTAAVLSQFYLTHTYFVGNTDVGAEKLYEFFRNLQLCHSLPFPPNHVKLFNLTESKNIMTYFCKVYLRNLPIIKLTSLPTFTLEARYHIEPDKPLGKKKGKGKDKKKKGKKKK